MSAATSPLPLVHHATLCCGSHVSYFIGLLVAALLWKLAWHRLLPCVVVWKKMITNRCGTIRRWDFVEGSVPLQWWALLSLLFKFPSVRLSVDMLLHVICKALSYQHCHFLHINMLPVLLIMMESLKLHVSLLIKCLLCKSFCGHSLSPQQ